MCGIVGLGFAELPDQEMRQLLMQMTDAITHRGPDEDGFFVSGPIGLGMRRLSIIDLLSGKQPVHNETGSIQIVFNGEIYNYLQLKTQLESMGHKFYTQSDTEVIVHAYEEYGDSFINKLRGMFAFAIWDAPCQRMVIAIDRFGIKPLYFSEIGGNLIFGSELNCLQVSGKVARELDYEALGQYFTFGFIPAPKSIYKEVQKLLPGHMLSWTPGNGTKVEPYWDIDENNINYSRSPIQTRLELLEKIKDAVRCHLISDVPLGAFLSGGIDSSVVVALMSQIMTEPVKTFSIGFEDKRYNELDKARLVANQFHTDHHEFIVQPETVDILPNLVSHFGEPFADSSALPTYYVSKMAKEYVKVALSGDGGDELFLGYNSNRGLELARYLQMIPSSFRNAASTILDNFPNINHPSWTDRIEMMKKRGKDSLLSPREAYKSKLAIGGLGAVQPMLSEDFKQKLSDCRPYKMLDNLLDSHNSRNHSHPLDEFVYAGLKFTLPYDMLVKVDRMSMANSLEVRVPLLDNVLAEFVATIPISQRFPRWRLKGLLKDTLSGVLPDEILHQPKKGFSIPLAAWFRGDMAGYLRDVLQGSNSLQRGFLNPSSLEIVLKQHESGGKNMSSLLWSLLVFELWCQQNLGG